VDISVKALRPRSNLSTDTTDKVREGEAHQRGRTEPHYEGPFRSSPGTTRDSPLGVNVCIWYNIALGDVEYCRAEAKAVQYCHGSSGM
jgi:hypothetical protein